MRTLLWAAATGLTLLFNGVSLPAMAQEKPSTILVLDASGSMWGQIDGVNKITIAREVITNILTDFPAEQNLGFVAYGHRERGACSDIQTMVEPAPGTASQIIDIVKSLNPRGMTPMTDAVIAAAEALRHTEQAATVILVSDGIETCNPDPCAAARALAQSGIDFTTHVIGFDVKGEAQALLQMQCIAEETGGQFLTADNAQELGEALQKVVEANEAPEIKTATLTELTMIAVMDKADGSQVETPVIWNFNLKDESIEIDGNPGIVELPAGAWNVTGYHMALEQEKAAQLVVVPGQPRSYTMIFETPTPTASLIAPDNAVAGSVIEIGWVGPSERNDSIQMLTLKGDRLNFVHTGDGNPLKLQMPIEPGSYQLGYSLNNREVIYTQPIEITPVEIGIIAPDNAAAGSVIEIGWVGPNARNDSIQIVNLKGDRINYVHTGDGNPLKLQMPIEPGDYQLIYSFNNRQPVHTKPIAITPVEIDIIAPDNAAAGSVIEIGWVGPNARNDSIQIVNLKGDRINYVHTGDGNPLKLQMPIEPGDYQLVYSFNNRQPVHTKPIEITPVEIDIIAPDSAAVGSVIEIGWIGPDARNDSIQIANQKGDRLRFAHTRDGNPVKLKLPDEPGDYLLRYSFNNNNVVHTRPIRVTQ